MISILKMKKKKFSVNNINITESNVQKFALIWEYNCSLTKLTRHLASTDCLKSVRIWSFHAVIIKLFKNCLNQKRRHSNKEDFSYLKFKDIQGSRVLLFRLAKHESQMKEVFSLLSKQIVYKNSSILSLTPFLDENNYSLFWWTLKACRYSNNQ